MNPQTPELILTPILPELILAGVAILILLVDAARPSRDMRLMAVVAMTGILAAAGVALRGWFVPPARELTVLGDMVAVDRYAIFFRLVILASAAVAVLFSAHYLRRTGEGRGEYYALLLFATSGMTLLAAAADLIVVPLALEVSNWLVADVYRYLTEALLRQGKVDDARELASFAGVNIPEEDPWARACALIAQGSVAAADGEAELSRKSFTEALELMERQRLVIEIADARVDFARALGHLGDHDGARAQLELARETFARIEAKTPLAEIDRELAELS